MKARTVDSYIAALPEERRATAEALRASILAADALVREAAAMNRELGDPTKYR